jgi:regulator of protease activity HflC (stomatin/prohibitin superfamily)
VAVEALTAAGLDPTEKLPALVILVAAGVMAVSALVLFARVFRVQEVSSIVSTVFGRLRRGG